MESTLPDTAPTCVASTFNLYNCSTADSVKREAAKVGQTTPPEPRNEDPFERDEETNFFKSAQWSPDGTCILTNSSDNHLRTFVLPTDLLEKYSPHELRPYSTLPSFEPIYSTALYPYFNLQDSSTTLLLSTPRDHPIRLTFALHPTPVLATYPLIHPPTEKYLTPHSLLFTSSGTHFLTGTDSLIALFDISRPGSGPIERHATIPSKRKKIVGGGVGMKGIVSCLAISREGVLAAGTFTRNVGLYDSRGSGDCIAVFSVSSSTTNSNSTYDNDNANNDIGGTGITQVLWSPCGSYLYVAERQSDGILVYDIRIAGKRLGCLVGRKADTNQRLGVDVVDTGWGNEIWAGGVDGVVRVWEHAGMMEGRVEARREWRAHDDAVSSTIVHPSGSVVATCSGQRHCLPGRVEDASDDSENSDSAISSTSSSSSSANVTPDNSLKIWRI